ncbi:hypothetical protein Tco_0889848 [Tanacetum coccineum]
MFKTRIARSFGLLTTEMIDVLNVEPPAHIFKKKSLIAMGIVMELHGGACYWPAAHEAGEGDEADGAAEKEMRANRGMDDRARPAANWMYDHTVRQFQYLSTRDNLELHLQIDPFPGREAGYPPYGYNRHMGPGYEYRFDPAHDGSS